LHYQLREDVTERLRWIGQGWHADSVPPVIVDAGANVGYSSLFFAETYPEATIIAVEPDLDAFEILCQNTRQRSNIRPIRAALWSHDRGVALRKGAHDSSWARQVGDHHLDEICGTDLTPSITLDGVHSIEASGRILILKLDIEGAESEVFRTGEATLRSTPCIIVEPHDFMAPGANCLGSLYEAIAGRPTDTLVEGENLVLIDTSPSAGASGKSADTSLQS
jgi:FkbM family methyltransferase